jgi:hypothetical protein
MYELVLSGSAKIPKLLRVLNTGDDFYHIIHQADNPRGEQENFTGCSGEDFEEAVAHPPNADLILNLIAFKKRENGVLDLSSLGGYASDQMRRAASGMFSTIPPLNPIWRVNIGDPKATALKSVNPEENFRVRPFVIMSNNGWVLDYRLRPAPGVKLVFSKPPDVLADRVIPELGFLHVLFALNQQAKNPKMGSTLDLRPSARQKILADYEAASEAGTLPESVNFFLPQIFKDGARAQLAPAEREALMDQFRPKPRTLDT